MNVLRMALLALAGYLLGSIPSGYWVCRIVKGVDIRRVGSGNSGAANVWRVAGFRTALAVALLDIAKGSAAAGLGLAVGGRAGAVVAGVGAMIGHWRPVFLGFQRGGKIVATTVGVAVVVVPQATLVAAVLWWAVFLTTRYSSVASLTAALALPALVIVFGGAWPDVLFTLAAAVAIVILHRANIGRLMRGTENRFTLHLPWTAGGRPTPRRDSGRP